MEGTPALRNNWKYPESLSPAQVLQLSMAPVNQAVQTYGDRQHELGTQMVQAAINQSAQERQQALAERLQQLRLTQGAAAVAARDKALLEWHQAADAAKIQAAGEARRVQGENEARQSAIKFANDRNLPVLPPQDGESTTAYVARQVAANTAGADKMKSSATDYVKSNMMDLAKVYNGVAALKQTITKESSDAVMSQVPQWIEGQPPEVQAAYNAAVAKGAKPQDAVMMNPALRAAWQPYYTAAVGAQSEKIMSDKGYDKNLSYLQSQAQAISSRLQQVAKTNPDYPEVYTRASQQIADDAASQAKQASDAAYNARKNGADAAAQQQLDQQAQAAKANADRIAANHQQLATSFQQVGLLGKLGEASGTGIPSAAAKGYATGGIPGAVGGAVGKVAVDALGRIIPTGSEAGTDLHALLFGTPSGAPAAADIAAFRASRGLPPQPQTNSAPMPMTNGVPSVLAQPTNTAPAAAVNPLSMPRFSVNDLINSGVIPRPQAPAPQADPQSSLMLPPLTQGGDDISASLMNDPTSQFQLTQ